MLQHKSLDQVFWAEAMCCANYIQNRSPHKALDGTTPFEAWCEENQVLNTLEFLGVLHGLGYLHKRERP